MSTVKRTFRADGKVTIRTDRIGDTWKSVAWSDKDILEQMLEILYDYAVRHSLPTATLFLSDNEQDALIAHDHAVERFDAAMMEYTFGEAA